MKWLIVVGLYAVMLVVPACRRSTSDLVSGTGTLLVTGDCHAWHVHADSGRYYQLLNLAPEFQRSDLRVRFTLKERNDLASACMMGSMADVVSMTRL